MIEEIYGTKKNKPKVLVYIIANKSFCKETS